MEEKSERKLRNYQPFMILIHLFAAAIYPFARTRAINAFYSSTPLLFWSMCFFWGTTCDMYSRSCRNPGYATPEDASSKKQGSEHPLVESESVEVSNNSEYFYCKICKMYVPFRTSHCRTCGKCVIRKDHHCPFTNQCIGRDNHCIFLFWCYCESILMFLALNDLISPLYHYSQFSKNPISKVSKELQPTSYLVFFQTYAWSFLEWLKLFKVNVILIPFCVFGFLMTFLLSFQHTAMAAQNLTTWEVSKRSAITYLNKYPVTYNPFDKGIWKNIREFLLMQKEKTFWTNLPSPRLSDFIYEQQFFSHDFFNSLIHTYSLFGIA